MQFYIYKIEKLKPFYQYEIACLFSFDKPLVIKGKEITRLNEVVIKNECENTLRVTLVKVISADNWKTLLKTYYDLTKEFNLNIKFIKDDYYYLIIKRPHDLPYTMAHRLIPFFPCRKNCLPIKLGKVKNKKEDEWDWDDDDESTARGGDFLTEDYFRYFTIKVSNLLYLYQGRHSLSYIVMEAFILTYASYFKINKSKDLLNKEFLLYQIIEKPYQPDDAAELRFITKSVIASEETYNVYIKPTLEGDVPFLPYGEFYSLMDKQEIVKTFWQFMEAAQKWVEENGNS